MGNIAIPIFQQAVNDDPKLFTQARAQITAAMYMMHEAIVRFDTPLGNIPYCPGGQGNWTADTDGAKRKQVCKE